MSVIDEIIQHLDKVLWMDEDGRFNLLGEFYDLEEEIRRIYNRKKTIPIDKMKRFVILKDYDNSNRVGYIEINGEVEKLLVSGKYVLAPGYIVGGEKENELHCVSTVHENELVREDGTPVLRKEVDK